MLPLLLELLWLARAVGRGVRDDVQFRAITVALTLLLAGGAVFYWQVEGWSLLDALYFCVMTMATVGYGDLAPGTPLAKAFTIGYAMLGVGLFAGFVGKLVVLAVTRRPAPGAPSAEGPRASPRA